MSDALSAELEGMFGAIGAQGRVHAVDIDSGQEVGFNSDTPSVTASIFKVAVVLELLLQVSEGKHNLAERVLIDGERTLGPVGLSLMQHPVEISLTDLIYLMMALSDNHATDVLCARVGIVSINERLRTLGLTTTRVVGDCRHMFQMMKDDYGVDDLGVVDRDPAPWFDRLRACRAMDPEFANRTTAREMTTLLRMIWRNEIGSREVCGGVRLSMSAQFVSRLALGFPDPFVRLWGKTGMLPHVRGEAGVIQFPDRRRVAVAVLMRLDTPYLRNAAADAAIGAAAAAVVRAMGR